MLLRVQEIYQKNTTTLAIRWNDGSQSLYDVRLLRFCCPCAYCLKKQTYKNTNITYKDYKHIYTRPKKIVSCGSYALQIIYNDGHSSGIYPFTMLKELSQRTGTYTSPPTKSL